MSHAFWLITSSIPIVYWSVLKCIKESYTGLNVMNSNVSTGPDYYIMIIGYNNCIIMQLTSGNELHNTVTVTWEVSRPLAYQMVELNWTTVSLH